MQRELCTRIAKTLASGTVHDPLGYEALAQLKLPGPDYRYLLKFLHAMLKPKLYVEIGVRDGSSLMLAGPDTHAIGIDPNPLPGCFTRRAGAGGGHTTISTSTSDRFFDHEPNREKVRGFDLAFIDGDHSFEQALRDFRNLEALAKPTSIICLHDVIPMDERTATPKAETAFHTGDVWRLMMTLCEYRPDLTAFTVACPPTGLGIVGGFGGGGICAWTDEDHDLDMDWAVLARRLKIVPNDGAAIGAAFMAARAA